MHELNIEMQRPIKMDGLTLAVTASTGIAMAPEHGNDAALLLQRADIAMYVAKERRGSVEVYSVEHDQSMQRLLMLGGLLTHTLETGHRAQPDVPADRGRPVPRHRLRRGPLPLEPPGQGFIPPEEFIGIAEQMGLIPQITDFVLNEGCAQLARWREAGITIGLAVNVSGREFADINLVERVETCLRRYDIPAHLLTLEVTETEIMADLGAATKVLYELSAKGIKLGIDDYGTGYSSLQYLHKLPVNELKIDRSFVTNLPNEESNRIIVRSSIQMAHSLGLYVIAEGAEDELTCAMLAEAECDFIQGYYLSKPQKADDLQEWILSGAQARVRAVDPDPRLGGRGAHAHDQVGLTRPPTLHASRGSSSARLGPCARRSPAPSGRSERRHPPAGGSPGTCSSSWCCAPPRRRWPRQAAGHAVRRPGDHDDDPPGQHAARWRRSSAPASPTSRRATRRRRARSASTPPWRKVSNSACPERAPPRPADLQR